MWIQNPDIRSLIRIRNTYTNFFSDEKEGGEENEEMDTGDIMSLLDAEQPPDYQQVIFSVQWSGSDSNSYVNISSF